MKRNFISFVLASGLSLGMLVGCDTAVQQTIYSGLETGSTAILGSLVKAFFQNISPQSATTTASTAK